MGQKGTQTGTEAAFSKRVRLPYQLALKTRHRAAHRVSMKMMMTRFRFN
jgi:hypothetical protein